MASVRQEVDDITRVLAELVIARREDTAGLRQLAAEVVRLSQENAALHAEIVELRRATAAVDATAKAAILDQLAADVRWAVFDLPTRLDDVEECIVGLEHHLRVKRRPKDQRTLPTL